MRPDVQCEGAGKSGDHEGEKYVKPRRSIRYRTPSSVEAQFQPGSRGRVLTNRLGITSKSAMDRAEYEALLTAQQRYLKRVTNETRFTAALLCQMHKDWLGGIYEWAGRYRTVELEKGCFRWPPAYRVAENMAAFENGLLRRHTPCRPGALNEVARPIAEVHAELLLIHPFREGNGRLARWLADLMCLQAGLPVPSYGFTGRGSKGNQEQYLRAVGEAYLRDYDALTAVFAEAIGRRLPEDR